MLWSKEINLMQMGITQKNVNFSLLFAVSLIIFAPFITKAADTEKESRISAESVQTLFIGDPIWLKHNDVDEASRFLGLLTTSSVAQVSIIMVHGTGQGPDTPYLIGPLREIFSDKDCNTLSIQMPVLSGEAAYKDYLGEFLEAGDRIQAAITYLLVAHPSTPIVILAHSMGSSMMMNWATKAGVANVHALVALGLGAINEEHSRSMLFSPYSINVPILDLFGEEDYEAVLWSAPLRKTAIASTNKASRQIKVESADHFFSGKEEATATIIWNWLGTLN
jgi:alpha/beta superfamily hydrolase